MSNKPTRVVVLGGGYVAIWFARAIKRAVKRGDIELTVVDHNNYHTFHGLVPEMLTGVVQAGQIISPARRLFAPGRFVCANVDAIDHENKRVTFSRVIDGKPATIEYDHLVVNLGSVDDPPSIASHPRHALVPPLCRIADFLAYPALRIARHGDQRGGRRL